jgi:hypothetical protein
MTWHENDLSQSSVALDATHQPPKPETGFVGAGYPDCMGFAGRNLAHHPDPVANSEH